MKTVIWENDETQNLEVLCEDCEATLSIGMRHKTDEAKQLQMNTLAIWSANHVCAKTKTGNKTALKRYVLFGGSNHESRKGGFRDFIGSYDSLEEAKAAEQKLNRSWHHIIDSENYLINFLNNIPQI